MSKYDDHLWYSDAYTAIETLCSLDNWERGHFAREVCESSASIKVKRAVLSGAWDHDHRYLIAACATRARLMRFFREARFKVPVSEPVVTIYRGTSALSLVEARRGWSWTLSRDVACWFAMRFAKENGNPLVMRAKVRREAIIYYSNFRSEAEVLIAGRPSKVAVDGEPQEWAERSLVLYRRRQLKERQRLKVAS